MWFFWRNKNHAWGHCWDISTQEFVRTQEKFIEKHKMQPSASHTSRVLLWIPKCSNNLTMHEKEKGHPQRPRANSKGDTYKPSGEIGAHETLACSCKPSLTSILWLGFLFVTPSVCPWVCKDKKAGAEIKRYRSGKLRLPCPFRPTHHFWPVWKWARDKSRV